KTVVHAESAKGNGKATVSPVVATAHQQATVAAPIVGSVPTTTSTPAPTENAASSTDAATTDTPSSAPAQKKSSIWNYIPKASEVNGWKPGRIKDNRPAYGSGPSSASGASSTAAAVPVDTTAQTAEPSMTDNADVAAVKSTDSATAPMVASQTVASTAGTALSAGSTPTSGTPEEPVYEQQAFAFLSEEARKSHRLIGQVFDTYWLIEYDGALYIIDQHAAHEKVLFERLMREYSTRKMASQVISPPEIINMTIAEEAVIQTYGEAFAALGFVIEPFGGRDFALREVPYTLESLGSRRLFEELLEALSHAVGRPGLQDLEVFTHRVATEACKAAVKGNDRLSFEEADALIRELLTLEDPYHCPHGRPTIITMTRADLEKRFKRIV
ncbi:MAG: hypothetical protein Q4B73_01695, partial [Lachnospiraceae bacterium]|nr:hypothetical protein [Lachnospiraceae bacterium]